MVKLVSEEGTRWSFLDGFYVFDNVVWLSDKNDISKYTLLDEDGNKMDVNVIDYIVDE